MFRKFALTAGALALAMGWAGSASAETVLRVASWAGPAHHMNFNLLPALDKKLQELTNGDLKLKIEFGLAPPPALYDTVRDGVADITWIVFGYTPGKFSTPKIAELPGMKGNAEQMSVAFQRTWDKYLSKAGEAKGVKMLAVSVHGPGMIHTVKKITSYKDVEGMKLRVGGGVANLIGTALGVAGVNVPAPKVYETIASGVAEGVFFPIETMTAFKVVEKAKYSFKNPDGMYTTAFGLILNQASYDKLSDANKKALDSITGEWLAREIGKSWDKADAIGLEAAMKAGIVITEASAEERAYYKQKTAGIEAAVVKEIDDRGVDGKAALAYFREQLN